MGGIRVVFKKLTNYEKKRYIYENTGYSFFHKFAMCN